MNTDLRLRDFFNRVPGNGSKVHILEFPSDRGVFINGGRPGSAKAPELIRARLNNLTPHAKYYQKHIEILERTFHAGTILCENEVKKDQERLGTAIQKRLDSGLIPIIIGGGHETSFGHFLGYVKSNRKVTIINIDAHTDVRELKNGSPHSGSPFRQAVEHASGNCKGYHVFGLNPASVSSQHYQYVKKYGSSVFEGDTTKDAIINRMKNTEGDVMITMDMDAVNHAYAPGVSSPNPAGLTKELWLDLAFEFGKNLKVTSFDLCEVNPVYDRDNQTVRLAAMTIWQFLLGLSMR